MRRALALAARGRGRVEPNPMVGCVIVLGGRVVGEGYHRRFGGPHAEVFALRQAGAKARGADVYVTLEPCCHFGKTPPCTEALIAARVGRVFAAMTDPFDQVAGKGLGALRKAGIETQLGLCAAEGEALAAPYLKRRRTGRPWVILKWAQSIDGKIADRTRTSQWISGEAARLLTHRWRGEMDAIVVGIETALHDDPLLTARTNRPKRVPARIVLDANLRLSTRAQLVRTAKAAPVLIATCRAATRNNAAKCRRLSAADAEVVALPVKGGRVDLAALLDELGRRDMTNVMVEGGGKVLGAFFDAGLADECRIFVSPRLIGGDAAPDALRGTGKKLAGLANATVRKVGEDLLYTLRL